MLRETIEHHRQGRLEEAEKGYREELAANPDSGEALRGLSAVRRLRGDLAESAELITRAHELAPEQPKLLLMLGSIQLESGNIEASRDAYERALTLDPNLAGAHTALGHIAMMKRRSEAGRAVFPHRPAGQRRPAGAQRPRQPGPGQRRRRERAQVPGARFRPGPERCRHRLRPRPRFRQARHERIRRTGLPQRPAPQARPAACEQRARPAADPRQACRRGRVVLSAPCAACAASSFWPNSAWAMPHACRRSSRRRSTAYQRALALKPDHENCFEALLWSIGKLGRGEEVMALLDSASRRFPEQHALAGDARAHPRSQRSPRRRSRRLAGPARSRSAERRSRCRAGPRPRAQWRIRTRRRAGRSHGQDRPLPTRT